MQIKITLQIITGALCLFIFSTAPAHAEQDSAPLRFSPIIIVDAAPGQGSNKILIMQPYPLRNDSLNYHHNPNELRIVDLNKYSLALGATAHINKQLNIGATCGVPLTNEETVQVEDISIEAMVTMQF
jgi:hypothetical protein